LHKTQFLGYETPTNPVRQKAGNPASDEQLMLAFSEGAAEVFAELFARYNQPVFGFFRRRVADPGHAERLTQETFLAIVRGALRYQPRALFRMYLFAIGFKILRRRNRADGSGAEHAGTPSGFCHGESPGHGRVQSSACGPDSVSFDKDA
jgi:Sigma-70 region 2